ncbi:TIGR04255 family protein [uncultured Methanobrevibacter sp.]|uniref:TIGR04255 family protein n=1 Tax=uncultured Methanobrevibacter sp. TaxID=253161 RepID=UPI002604B5F0|nr:TIGR04255 family protein [uncultured Methanobrevibacter sp.]
MKYSKNFLEEVILHIKYQPLPESCEDFENATQSFQNIITKEFPETGYEKKKNLSFTIDSTGKPIKADSKYATLTFTNEGKQIKFNEEELILSYSGKKYRSYEEFKKDINLVLKGLKEFELEKIKFLGLRYINQIKLDDNTRVNEYINPNLNLINIEFDNKEFIQSITRAELKIDDYNLAFQYGQYSPNFPGRAINKEFILDYDCVLDFTEEFKYIPIDLDEMHEIIINRFEHDIKDKLREKMR